MFIFKLLKSLFRSSSNRGHPTSSQVEYLEKLIVINNSFRATPRSLNDWIKIYYKGKWDFWRASKLIEKLKLENSEKHNRFSEKISESFDRKGEKTIFASDFSAYGFCPNSFYLGYRGYSSKNLYELEKGHYLHGEYAGRKGKNVNQNNQFLLEQVDEIRTIKWFKLSKSETIYEKEKNLAGIPDGIITFKDNENSIVEIKSNRSAKLKEPYWGDIMQACAYIRICKNSSEADLSQMSSRAFIIYINSELKERQLFEIDYDQYKDLLQNTLLKMENTFFTKDLYYSLKNMNKCPSCGYRAACKNMS